MQAWQPSAASGPVYSGISPLVGGARGRAARPGEHAGGRAGSVPNGGQRRGTCRLGKPPLARKPLIAPVKWPGMGLAASGADGAWGPVGARIGGYHPVKDGHVSCDPVCKNRPLRQGFFQRFDRAGRSEGEGGRRGNEKHARRLKHQSELMLLTRGILTREHKGGLPMLLARAACSMRGFCPSHGHPARCLHANASALPPQTIARFLRATVPKRH